VRQKPHNTGRGLHAVEHGTASARCHWKDNAGETWRLRSPWYS